MNKNFINFLINSKKKGYVAGEANIIHEEDHSFSTRGSEGDFAFHDNWFGGEPYGGREVVFKNNKPSWMMVYYGSVEKESDGVIPTLRVALSQLPEDFPARGPKEFKNGEYVYLNDIVGSIERFSGQEKILLNGEQVYSAHYAGGLVDVQKE